eukprot:TRINITY_DN1576_c0_g1_i1.p1 TRINITY_DN1576_c0_g1~~TRINITY_DN1576_c0_g1_i1.p1  ORF type:complete len:107 (+),score=7.92 TRINITY_DN1576_c0_g1_i1:137-457(+)
MKPLNPEETSDVPSDREYEQYLEKISAGHVDEVHPENEKETQQDKKHEYYHKLKYKVDPKEGLIQDLNAITQFSIYIHLISKKGKQQIILLCKQHKKYSDSILSRL